MSDIPVWNCDFFALKDQGGVELDALTVGAKFGWKCHGDLAVNWDATAPVVLGFAKEDQAYSLAILKVVRQDPNDVQYIVTGYKAGDHKPEYVRVLQARGTPQEKGFEATAPKWQIKSVLDPKQQPPQAYPALGPWHLGLPYWLVLLVVFLLASVTFYIYRRIRKYNQRRRMLEDLKLHKTALTPLHQFYRDARQLRRRLHVVKEAQEIAVIGSDLERDFRLFVLRKFQIPTLDWSDRAILEDLRKRHKKIYRVAGVPLRRTLRELSKLKAQKAVVASDVEQLHRMSLDTAERLEGGGPA